MFRDSLLDDVAQSDSIQLAAFNANAIDHIPRHPLDTMTAMIIATVVAGILAVILVGYSMISKKAAESRGLQSLYLAVFLDSFGAMCTLPFMGVFIAIFDCTAFESSLISGAFAFCQFMGTILLGILSDKVDSRLILLCTLFFCSIALIIGGLTTLLPRQCTIASLFEWHCQPFNVNGRYVRTIPGGFNPAFWSLLASRALAGFFASTVSVIETMISKMSSDEERTANVAQVMAFFGMGMMGGPIIGGLLYDYGIALLCYCAGSITIVNVIYAFFTLDTSHLNRKSLAGQKENPQVDTMPMPRTVRRRSSNLMLMELNADSIASMVKTDGNTKSKEATIRELRRHTPGLGSETEKKIEPENGAPLMDAIKAFLTVPFIFVLLSGTFLATAAPTMCQVAMGMLCLQVYGWGGTEIGFMTTIAGLAMVFAQSVLAGRISSFFGESGSVILGNFFRAVIFLIFAFFRNPAVPWVCGPVGMTSSAFVDAPLQTLLARVSPPQSLGSLMGFMQALRSLGEAISPLIAGALMDLDLAYPMVLSAVIAICCGLLFLPYINLNHDRGI